jgi:hypothetical protein
MKASYSTFRDAAQDFDAVFFCRKPWNISNAAIAASQFWTADHRKYHNFIHVELLHWSDEMGERRLRSAGFSARTPEGLEDRYASERIGFYGAPVLYLPLRADVRLHFDIKHAAAEFERAIGAGYNKLNLPNAIFRLWASHPMTRKRFCSQFAVDIYKAGTAIPTGEYAWDDHTGDVVAQFAESTRWNPCEMIERLNIFDWDNHLVLGE